MDKEKEALSELLRFLADHPEFVETVIVKPSKVLKQSFKAETD